MQNGPTWSIDRPARLQRARGDQSGGTARGRGRRL